MRTTWGIGLAILLTACAEADENIAQHSDALAVCDPRAKTCSAGPVAFMIRAYAGQVVKDGGKCLDYDGEIVGSPVTVNDCSRAHPIVVEELPERLGADGCARKHEVILRAGTRVIGMGETVKGLAGPEIRLELQELGHPSGDTPLRDPMVLQRFASDGDSIIVAADRDQLATSAVTRVAKVQNSRGRNGSPVVVGPRELADNELWDFASVDGSHRDPTTGFVHVAGLTELRQYFDSNAAHTCAHPESDPKWPDYDTVVVVDSGGPSEGPVGDKAPPSILITDGVTVRGDRRGTRLGPLLDVNVLGVTGMFRTLGNDIRITGLRINGPTRATDADYDAKYPANGVSVSERDLHYAKPRASYSRIAVDHNDISDWVTSAVLVTGGDEKTVECVPLPSAASRPNHVRVARNFLHHTRVEGSGYGVNAKAGAFPMIDGNTFVSNRHAIAETASYPLTGYRAWSNIVLDDAPIQYWGIVPYHTHDFDIHGTGEDGFGGIGGGYTEIARNTFLGAGDGAVSLPRANFKARGVPCDAIEYHDNISLQSEDDTVKFQLSRPPFDIVGVVGLEDVLRIAKVPNQFSHDNPTKYLTTGDFDGDGRTDLFLATGTAWYYSPGGEAEWRLLSRDKTDPADSLLFGDFDGDGRTDVVGQNGKDALVSWGGVGEWEYLNFVPPWNLHGDPSLRNVAVGNFDGVGGDDLFFANGDSWYVAAEGSGPWIRSGPSSFRVEDVRFGDFNGNGTTDVFGYVGGRWSFSDGTTVNWAPLPVTLTSDISTLFVADIDGNHVDDIVTFDIVSSSQPLSGQLRWKYSKDAAADWAGIAVTDLSTRFAAVGRFRSAPSSGAALLFWDDAKLRAAYLGSGGLAPHSRQDMR